MNNKIILSSLASDAHTWNLVYLQLLLEEYGHEVINLGACVSTAVLIQKSLRVQPALIVISTINGHGFYEGCQLVETVKQNPYLKKIPMIIGGKLDVNDNTTTAMTSELMAKGYEGVFIDDDAIEGFLNYLNLMPQSKLMQR